MNDFPADLAELARALDDPASSAWWVGSAEGGWEMPSEDEWAVASAGEGQVASSSAAA